MASAGRPCSAATRPALSGWPLTRAARRALRQLRKPGTICPSDNLPRPTTAKPTPSPAGRGPAPPCAAAGASIPAAALPSPNWISPRRESGSVIARLLARSAQVSRGARDFYRRAPPVNCSRLARRHEARIAEQAGGEQRDEHADREDLDEGHRPAEERIGVLDLEMLHLGGEFGQLGAADAGRLLLRDHRIGIAGREIGMGDRGR